MTIKIEHLDNEFKFFKNDSLIFFGDYGVSWLKVKKNLYDLSGKKITEISTRIGIKGIRSEIFFKKNSNSAILKLKGSIMKNYYECFYQEDNYQIIKHKGYYTSIFKNNKQIGYYNKSKIIAFNPQKISLTCNNDINQELIYSFILALELSPQEQNKPVSVDFGNITKEYKPFNNNWKPSN